MKRSVLVTGGAGFIGKHLIGELLAHGFEVTCIDDLSTGQLSNLKNFFQDSHFHFIPKRVQDCAELEKIINDSSVVFHLAATVGVQNVVDDPIETIENNIYPTGLVLKLAKKLHKRTFIFSTSEVYGKSQQFPFKESGDLVLGAPTKLRWAYACSKLLDEYLAHAYFEAHRTPVTIVRLFNTIGQGQLGNYGMVVPRFFTQALANEPVTVYGSGMQTRCFSDVRDVVAALVKLIDVPESHGEIVNIGNNCEISIMDLAKKIIRFTGSRSTIVNIAHEKVFGLSFEDMNRRVPDNAKVQRLANFKFSYSLDDTVRWIAESFLAKGKDRTESPDVRT